MKTALVLIDIQKGLDEVDFYGGERSHPEAEKNCSTILEFFREHALPVFHVKHNSINAASPLHPSKAGNQIKEEVFPQNQEPVYEKSVNSAFIGTELATKLEKSAIKQVIIVGLTIEHCISTSVRMAANLGFKTILVEDATAAFAKKDRNGKTIPAETVHRVTIANLEDEFACIHSTVDILSVMGEKFFDFK
jgi:nicotinamidase-related amidase